MELLESPIHPTTGNPDRFRVGERVIYGRRGGVVKRINHRPGHTVYIVRINGRDGEFLAADLRPCEQEMKPWN